MKKVLATASSGGHWVQLQRLRPAWDGCQVCYLTHERGHRKQVDDYARAQNQPPPGFYTVIDANQHRKLRLLLQIVQVAWVVIRVRPDIVISTGASVGVLAARIAKLTGARTVWIDSIANAEKLSLSGRIAGRFVDTWLTQWEHLTEPDGAKRTPTFAGSVL